MTSTVATFGVAAGRRGSAIPADVEPTPRAATETDRLLEDVGRGNRDAFAQVYDQTSPLVYGIALRVARDPARAEEITQDVFLDVWRTAARYVAVRGSARGWIATIAHRRAVDVVRSEQASRERMERIGSRVDAAYDEVVEAVVERDDRRRVAGALDSLSKEQRQAIEMAYFGGLTYREVAARTGIPLGTVKTRMRAALRRLGNSLESDHG